MSQKRLSTWQKATALVPLALLSGAWTANLSMTSTASAAPSRHESLPLRLFAGVLYDTHTRIPPNYTLQRAEGGSGYARVASRWPVS